MVELGSGLHRAGAARYRRTVEGAVEDGGPGGIRDATLTDIDTREVPLQYLGPIG
jgi:hypothetical protein